MASNDWESLMNGVFGSGGRLRSTAKPEKTLEEMQKQLDTELQQQAKEISKLGSQLTQTMQQDGLLSPAQAAQTPGATPSKNPDFSGLDALLGQTVLGQPDFVTQLILAFKRPFVAGTAGTAARNSLLIYGKRGTGRHLALQTLANLLAKRGILPNAEITTLRLSLYPGPAQEKLFLQDLYAALSGSGQIVVFQEYEDCHPGFLRHIAALVQQGSTNLASRYVVQKGMLVDAGNALVPNAVGQLTPQGKYLVFLGEKGPDFLAERLGADFVDALGDLCHTQPLEDSTLTAIAAKELNELAQRSKSQLGLVLRMDAALRDFAAQQSSIALGAAPIAAFCHRCYKALCEYKLRQDPAAGTPVALTAAEGCVTFAPQGQPPASLFALLRGEYTGAMEQIRQELNNIVGLDRVKEYVLALQDHVQVQQRRSQAGMKSAGLSMHMIFTGNPGTGKTTIARLVGKYLKAIGALRGGQLVEVSRGDLVGRYVGHTAPLTQQVVRSALGGVLFIDEAYSLYRGSEDSFGLEAIDTLVKEMEDHREDLVVILAGYSHEMQEFLQANSGLQSRFPNQIEFPDYTGQELWQITQRTATGKGYRLAAECEPALVKYYTKAQQQNAAKNGNGRLARNKLEQAILNQSRRLVAEPSAPLDELILGDFELDDLQ